MSQRNRWPWVAAVLLCCAIAGQTPASAGSSFNWQGRLSSSGVDVNDIADFRFKLFDAASGGNQIGATFDVLTYQVIEGEINVEIDFGANAFPGADRWLEVAVRVPAGGGAYSTLSPRQAILPTPYAIRADQVSQVASEAVSGIYSEAVVFSNASNSFTGIMAGNGSALTALNATNLSSGTLSAARLPNSGNWSVSGTMNVDSGTLVVNGSSNRVGIGTSSPVAALHVRANTLGSGNHTAVFEAPNLGPRASNVHYGGNGDWYIRSAATAGKVIIQDGGGNVGIGTTSPVVPLHIGSGTDASPTGGGFFQVGNSLNIAIDDNEIVARNSGTAATLHLNADGGDVRVGQNAGGSSTLHAPEIVVGDVTELRITTDEIISSTSGVPSNLYINPTGGDVRIGHNSGGTSTLQTPVLEITGGSDLSEQFDVAANSEGDSPAPGMVVCIDSDHSGRLILSSTAYDRTVAGVISGAGGVNPGMMMGQKGSVADGAYPVALTGRVYVMCDASKNAIQPGDLLTTSDLPGYAMKVTDYARAHGAIIGKAMSSLDEREGLVLVLISLH